MTDTEPRAGEAPRHGRTDGVGVYVGEAAQSPTRPTDEGAEPASADVRADTSPTGARA